MPIKESDLKELKKELLLQFFFDHSQLVKRIETLENEIKKLLRTKNKK